MELCNNMEITNPYAIRMLLNQPKTTPYSDIFKIVNIKSWTNDKKHKLLFYFKDIYQIWGQPILRKYFQLAAITMIITILGYIINSVNLAATLSRAKNWRSHGRLWRVKTDQGHQELTVKCPMCDYATEFRKVAI